MDQWCLYSGTHVLSTYLRHEYKSYHGRTLWFLLKALIRNSSPLYSDSASLFRDARQQLLVGERLQQLQLGRLQLLGEADMDMRCHSPLHR